MEECARRMGYAPLLGTKREKPLASMTQVLQNDQADQSFVILLSRWCVILGSCVMTPVDSGADNFHGQRPELLSG